MICQIIYDFLDVQRSYYYLDFDDLIYFTLYVFSKYPEILLKYQKQFQYVMVDEFQDIDPTQFQLTNLLSGYHQNLFVVGDPDQMIYSWRGAEDFLYPFERYFPHTKTITLDINYRSTPEIIQVSNSLISHNTARLDKTMIATRKNGTMPIYYHAKNRDDEASFISEKIKKYHEAGTNYKDMAILYRTNHHSRFLEEELRKNHIPYVIYGNLAFYERKEIKDLLSYLRFVITQDDLSFERIINSPARLFGPKKLLILKEAQKQNGKSLYENLLMLQDNPVIKKSKAASFIELMKNISKNEEIPKVSELLSELYQKSGYEKMVALEADDERIGNINELFAGIKEKEESEDGDLSLDEYLDSIALLSNQDEIDKENKDEVRLMTAHLSKGQEFQFVFICCLNENNFPTSRSNTVDKLEEERRLFYVAITRAKDILYLTDADGYDFSSGELVPSRFLYDIDFKLLMWMGEKINQTPPPILPLRGKTTIDVTTLYARGEKVSHPVFGLGVIVEIDIPNSTYLVQFEHMASIRSIAFDFPNLLKVIEEQRNCR